MRGGETPGQAVAAGTLPAWLATQRDRLTRWAAWCAAGRCKYAELTAEQAQPVRSGDTCPGYTGTLHVEEDAPLFRLRACPHRVAWWQRRQAWLRTQRPARPTGGRTWRPDVPEDV